MVNYLADAVALHTQRILFDKHTAQLPPPCGVVELVAHQSLLAVLLRSLEPGALLSFG